MREIVLNYKKQLVQLKDDILKDRSEQYNGNTDYVHGKVKGIEASIQLLHDTFYVREGKTLEKALADLDLQALRRRIYFFQCELYDDICDISADYGYKYNGDSSTEQDGYFDGLIESHKIITRTLNTTDL